MANTLSFLVDAASVGTDPRLSHLLSFGSVEGIGIEQHVAVIQRDGQSSIAVLGEPGTQHVSVAPLNQLKRFAVEITAQPDCSFSADVVERALIFSHIANLLDTDAIVSPARSAFGPRYENLVDTRKLVTVAEALSMIGANVRQRSEVPLGGSPMLVQQRTEVYPLTATVIIPNGQTWWSSCVQATQHGQNNLVGYAGAVFKRVGQALRARDAVHETLRLESGRAAILDALYHFDVVLTSGVGALDALARAAHELSGMTSTVDGAGWQKCRWRKELKRLAPSVDSVIAPHSRLAAALLILTRLRNSIHSIPLDEYLYVEAGHQRSIVEHRAMIMRDLALRLQEGTEYLGPLDTYGIFIDNTGGSFLNVAQLTEQLLALTIEIIGALLGAMLSPADLVHGIAPTFAPLQQHERELCAALARVGEYPYRGGPIGLRARPSLHRTVMASIHNHLHGRP